MSLNSNGKAFMKSGWSLSECLLEIIWFLKGSVPVFIVWTLIVVSAETIGEEGRTTEWVWLVMLLLLAWAYYWVGKDKKNNNGND